jgi:hypothetical protein
MEMKTMRMRSTILSTILMAGLSLAGSALAQQQGMSGMGGMSGMSGMGGMSGTGGQGWACTQ